MERLKIVHFVIWINILHNGVVNGGIKHDVISDGEAPHIIEQPLDVTVARHQPATLNCRAGGLPKPTIQWYKGGVPVAADSYRMILPAGALFFLRATHGKSHSDAGIYWCEATNIYGTARSRNATIHVAVLREDFRLEPSSIHTAQGETVLLECAPPRGSPEPTVDWKKNGQIIHFDVDSRMHLVDGGSLVIQDTRQSDAGGYQCVARNAAGSRESAVATLKIHIKPYLITGPEDVITQTGGSVTFQCRVGGDPLPEVMWRRSAGGGTMPFGRVKTLDDRSLLIDDVTIADEGEYFCEADNSVGSVSASGMLTVYDPPTVYLKQTSITIQKGESAIFECILRGRPDPTMFWSIEGNRTVIFSGMSQGRYETTDIIDGVTTLTIFEVDISDTGLTVVCSAVNFAGSAIVRGKLRVSSTDDTPPPIITIGPSNQTLPIKSIAVFPCTVIGSSKADVTWYYDGTPLSRKSNKINITTEALIIKDLERVDSGIYTCVASSKNGKYIWSGQLIVDTPTNPNLHFFRAPDASSLPGPPLKLHVVNQTDRSITISWYQNNKIGSSSLLGYRIEMFSREIAERDSVRSTHTWVTIAERVKETIFTINNLLPDASYLFFVRAENSHGISEPSILTEPISLNQDNKSSWDTTSLGNTSDVRSNILNNNIVELIEATPLDSVTIKVMWEVLNFYYLQGIYIYYRCLDEFNKTNNFEKKTILHSNDVSGFEISNLIKFTRYEFFLVPFYKNFEGKPSNSRVAQTLDDVPDGPPTDVEMYIINATTVHLKWSPPEPRLQNGIITSYNVIVHWLDIPANKSMVAINTTIDSATSLIMTNLTSGVSYSVQVSAATAVGYGPFTPITYINIETNSIGTDILNRFNNEVSIVAGDFVMEMWVFLLIGAVAIFKITVIGAIIYLRRNNIFTKKDVIPNIYDSNGTSLVTQMNIKTAVSLSHPLSSCYNKSSITKTESLLWMDNQSGRVTATKKNDLTNEKNPEYDRVAQPLPEYAEVTSSRVTENEWNTSKTDNSPAAYASVTLVANTRQCGWFPQNKQSSFNARYGPDDEMYPASNGGYYNRNVYSEKLRKPINFYDFNHKASSMYNQCVNSKAPTRIYEDDNTFESDEDNYADDDKASEYGNVQAMRLLNHHYARPTFNDEHDDSRKYNRTLSRLTSFKRNETGVKEQKNETAPR